MPRKYTLSERAIEQRRMAGKRGGHKSLGRKLTDQHKKKISLSLTGKVKSEQTIKKVSGKNNKRWKGSKVSYRALHSWVQKHLGKPDKCSTCLKSGLTGRKIHWSNISGDYKRDLQDWQRLCAKCHSAYDAQLRLARIGG